MAEGRSRTEGAGAREVGSVRLRGDREAHGPVLAGVVAAGGELPTLAVPSDVVWGAGAEVGPDPVLARRTRVNPLAGVGVTLVDLLVAPEQHRPRYTLHLAHFREERE